jgi:hypothetical protein
MKYSDLKKALDKQLILGYSQDSWVLFQKSIRFVLAKGVEVDFDASSKSKPRVESKDDDLFLHVKVSGTENESGRDISIAIHNILYFEVTSEKK